MNLSVLRRHPVSAVLELQRRVQNGSTVIPICLWGLCKQIMKLPLMAYASCVTTCYQTILCYLSNFEDIVKIALNVRTHILVFFFKRKLEALTNYQSLIVKSSKTDNENATGLLHSELPYCTRRRSPYSCRNPN